MRRAFFFAILLVTYPVSASIDFDNADDILDCSRIAAWDNLAALSVSLWVNMVSAGEGSNARMVNKAGSSVGSSGWRFIFNSVSRDLNFIQDCVTTDMEHPTSTTISANAWTHLAVTWDGSDTATNILIYVNGTEASYASSQDCVGGQVSDAANSVLMCNSSNSTRTCDGFAEEVAVWSSVLTASQISQLASARVRGLPLQVSPSTLLIYTSIDDEPNGTSFNADTAVNRANIAQNCTGDDGANNTGLTADTSLLTYP